MEFEFMVGIASVVSACVGVLVAIYKPLKENTKQMTELTETMKHYAERMDAQDKLISQHIEEFELYKKHVSEGQKRQWNEINEHHDMLIEHKNKIENLEKGGIDNV